ncbi:unnamed protein product [Trichobilharzia szidati]|nr:unnamed protein product [Trichobilharzia szidati]CAH8838701.1 unnamed protein product [Trichobilharzia szidati]
MITIVMSDDDCFLVDFCNFIITVFVVVVGAASDLVLSLIPTSFHFSSCSSVHNPCPHSLFVIYIISSQLLLFFHFTTVLFAPHFCLLPLLFSLLVCATWTWSVETGTAAHLCKVLGWN